MRLVLQGVLLRVAHSPRLPGNDGGAAPDVAAGQPLGRRAGVVQLADDKIVCHGVGRISVFDGNVTAVASISIKEDFVVPEVGRKIVSDVNILYGLEGAGVIRVRHHAHGDVVGVVVIAGIQIQLEVPDVYGIPIGVVVCESRHNRDAGVVDEAEVPAGR